ncbi:MAG: bifunctional precorrin-2 dehydrogenase/sirohydrochlorin ferrochelatase [Acidobacteria bacterium]|nr:bifunctional precorrin-2 dehydrogenase/sirohydrochlorin ferrochelatase [Acidobacteriota bacterium]
MSNASLFPMFLKLEGRTCLVLGAGSVGEQKIRSLFECGAHICVVATWATGAVKQWAQQQKLTLIEREYEPGDLDDAYLVIAATSDVAVNHAIYREAQARGILCNVVDDPPYCDFYYGALVRRGHLQISISTNGLSPALAQRIRKQFEEDFPPVYGQWLEELGCKREALFRAGGDPEERKQTLHRLATHEAFLEFESSQLTSISESGKEVL